MGYTFSGTLSRITAGMVTGKAPRVVTGTEKVREIRLRRTADRRGYRLERCRRRDPHALGYGTYRLLSVSGEGASTDYGLTLDDVENALSPVSA